ncbi:TSL-kinase interacting protein 1 isoform X1 [Amborella trichopoda]|uniref:TSL-kinase interacting protein 1 isoform X1 n=2 Tax=Amborella trichopoda TaxID=13333 RepID=UPI0009BE8650|nr:TSL-kinase interacting protein 1 isoform X1 [Amborella trichopoda]|eukprot:XP_006854485.3 TSL-kinase interacting protein 1 isoform X1 [Amborella trichopoda]
MQLKCHMALENEPCSPREILAIKDGHPSAPSSSPSGGHSEHSVKKSKKTKQPKQPTRQWAAWTRQEEESFFSALRQVGKNFEKITSRVQSKNKDQVRHYYYRLIRRMNKLLGPGFTLDAKNSKDANAAMLRWWSLLEKQSCSASKLHLKPRRFKTFVTALGDQLLKDRKKTRKQPASVDQGTPSSLTMVSSPTKVPGNDARVAKVSTVDSQNMQKIGSGKGASLKRNMGINCGKGDSSSVKNSKQRRRTTSNVSSAAYKRWEKAAIAGVSLVAEAAEHLERTSKTPVCDELPHRILTSADDHGNLGLGDNVDRPLPLPESPSRCRQMHVTRTSHLPTKACPAETGQNVQPFVKLKLQLFPIDESTRRGLETDEINPHLQLTLRSGKKIPSVLDHLNRKWGHSSVASGELMLFPYDAQQENLDSCQRWTMKETTLCAADLYAILGYPELFRLRYGWFSDTGTFGDTSHSFDDCLRSGDIQDMNDKIDEAQLPIASKQEGEGERIHTVTTEQMMEEDAIVSAGKLPESWVNQLETISSYWLNEKSIDGSIRKLLEDTDNSKTRPLSAGDWGDNLTTISVGDLLSEASRAEHAVSSAAPCLPPFISNSFDASFAATHMRERQDVTTTQLAQASSIWDAEETCDGFVFRKNKLPMVSSSKDAAADSQDASGNPTVFSNLAELSEKRPSDGVVCQEDLKYNMQSHKETIGDGVNNCAMTDLFWADSLGSLDMCMPYPRYQFEESASLAGLIASSLDALQNCSLFGTVKKFESQLPPHASGDKSGNLGETIEKEHPNDTFPFGGNDSKQACA